MPSRAALVTRALRRRAGPAMKELWRAAHSPVQRRERVRGRIDSLRDEAAAHDIQFRSIRPAKEIVRRPPRTLDEQVPTVFARLANHTHPEAFLAVIPHGRIAGAEPLVLTAELDVLLQSTWDLEQLEANPVVSSPLPRPRHAQGPHAALVNPWCWAYFHWLLDALPRASLLPLTERPDLRVVVPEPLSRFQRETLDSIGIPPERRVGYDRTQLAVDELWFPSLGRTGNPPRWVVDWLRARLAPPPALTPTRRLYVSRADAPQRRLVNEREVAAMLAEHGFEVFQGEGMPFADQVRLFSETSIIVGPHGAGLVNSFAARDATIVELFDPEYVNGCYYALADAAGHDYWFLLGENVGGSDLRVDLDRLERTLEAVL